jgi:hypothetical protein
VGKCFTLQAPVDTLFQLSLDSHAMLLSLIRQILVVPAATVVLGLAVILLCPFDPSRRLFNRIARLWSRLLCLSAGVTVKVRGLEHVALDRPAVFIANHQSLFDPPVLFLTVPGKLRVIAKHQEVTDEESSLLASEIAARIQAEVDYPGKIKVTVIREMWARATAS